MKEMTTGADALLQRLKAIGVDYLFANAGSDFAPIIEAYARRAAEPDLYPKPVTVAHESVAVAMAHGYYLATGQPQAVMVHVNVGLANAVMGILNAQSDNAPIILLSGRTPLTAGARPGARVTLVQYGQEMFDQTALVREATKWQYELRYPEQAAAMVSRAYAIAMSEPRGPVYLSLPREPLAAAITMPQVSVPILQKASVAPGPDHKALEQAATWLAEAKAPLMILQRGDVAGRVGAAAARLAAKHAIQTIEFGAVRNLLSGDHPMRRLTGPEQLLPEADVVLAVDASVPWIESKVQPAVGARVIHVGADPLFQNLPMRGHQTDLAIAGNTAVTLTALADALDRMEPETGTRYQRVAAAHGADIKAMASRAAAGCRAPTNANWVAHCVSGILQADTIVVTERGPRSTQLMLKRPNQLFTHPLSGGLGWGAPAAIGVALASRHEGSERLVVAIVGDGSYIFANPVALHQVLAAYNLPLLMLILNNGLWNAVEKATTSLYPAGAAAQLERMPLTELVSPDYVQIAQASGAYAERVADGRGLPDALQRAISILRAEKRPVLLEIMTDDSMT